eukprot:CAMPEP_0206056250 /NCGR_PEP_ID=MMETSP1466-20131121/41794_1 /ASSEMBLY_ACC=CAM_ASM_001126 /TAXON_ID=44452 /ORGANISM="Pavlova gyrans, Strain CCMP608" /LENGTH=52 /DNA_ID=CAMNT_0053431483 /DNA_START=363 /DNA_END=517 /DNA_ORIENTATION=+
MARRSHAFVSELGFGIEFQVEGEVLVDAPHRCTSTRVPNSGWLSLGLETHGG